MVRFIISMKGLPTLTRLVVIISNRLVSSPCAIVADEHGYTANVEKLISELSLRLT